jgi:hypothetical protein
MMKSINKIVKHKLFKLNSVFILILFLGWSMSSVADDDIKSATNNFSAMGLVSQISDNTLEIKEAKGSDKSGKTEYDLNIENLEKIETGKNEVLNFSDIKEGDKVIVQGLTNGSTFFVKRIISFTSISTFVATTTEDVVGLTATSTDELASTSTDQGDLGDTGSNPEIPIISTTTDPIGDDVSTTTVATTTEQIDNGTSSPEIASSTNTDENSTSTVSTIIDDVVDTIIGTVNDFIENIIETVTGDTPNTPDTAPVEENTI